MAAICPAGHVGIVREAIAAGSAASAKKVAVERIVGKR